MTGDLQYVTTSDGCRIAVRRTGRANAPEILFSNSLGTDHTMWFPQVETLGRDFSIVQYDTRGHGASDAPAGAYSIDRLSLDVIEVMDTLDIARTHFCGVSLGGMTGQRLAWRAPDRFASMSLAATSAYMGTPRYWQERINTVLSQGVKPVADKSLAVWFSPEFVDASPDAPEALQQVFYATDPVGYAGCCAAIRDMDQRPTVRLTAMPTLVISGDADPATPLEHGRFLHEQIEGSRFLVLEGAHLINLESANAFTAALRAHVEEIR